MFFSRSKYIVIIAVSVVVVIIAVFMVDRAEPSVVSPPGGPAGPPSPSPVIPDLQEIPSDWILIEDAGSGYSISYPPTWEPDSALEEAPQAGIRIFATKERDPSEGYYILSSLEPGEASLERLEEDFATSFRAQAMEGTLTEETVGIHNRQALSLEATIKNAQTNELVKAYLLLISSVDGKKGYAISFVGRGPKTEEFAADARLITLSLKFL